MGKREGGSGRAGNVGRSRASRLPLPYKPFQFVKRGGFGNGGPASITMSVWASSLIAAGLPLYALPFTHTLSAPLFAACADAAAVLDIGWPQISKKSPSVNVRSR